MLEGEERACLGEAVEANDSRVCVQGEVALPQVAQPTRRFPSLVLQVEVWVVLYDQQPKSVADGVDLVLPLCSLCGSCSLTAMIVSSH